MNLEPLLDRVLIRRLDEDEDPDSLIEIPETAQEKSMKARVEAVGPGRPHGYVWDMDAASPGKPRIVPPTLRVGDVVLVGKYAGVELEYDGYDYALIREDEVLARISASPKPEAAEGAE